MNNALNRGHRVKQNKENDIERLIESIQVLTERLEKTIKIQEKLFFVEQKKLLRENKFKQD